MKAEVKVTRQYMFSSCKRVAANSSVSILELPNGNFHIGGVTDTEKENDIIHNCHNICFSKEAMLKLGEIFEELRPVLNAVETEDK